MQWGAVAEEETLPLGSRSFSAPKPLRVGSMERTGSYKSDRINVLF